MTKRLFILIIAILLMSCNEHSDNNQINPDNNQSISDKLILSSDSGFVTKKMGLSFLLSNNLTDTSEFFWNQIVESDTIAKYYQIIDNGNYIYCTIELSKEYSFRTNLLIELTKEGEIVRIERFFHGNNPCCWKNYYEGFHKYGEYFGIKICGTGSGYCASYLFLFKDIISQDSQKAIPLRFWSYCGGQAQCFNSAMEIEKDILRMHYKLEDGILDDSSNFKVTNTKTFEVKYFFRDKVWNTNDSLKFEGLDLWF